MSSRIVDLSSRIATNTKKLHDYLEANGLPTPSFNADGPLGSQVPDDEPEIEVARIAIVNDTRELRSLVLGPRDFLMSHRVSKYPKTVNPVLIMKQHNGLLSQQAIVRFGLARTFPVGQESTFADIAKASGLYEPDVRQLLRHAMVENIFSEPRPGHVAHTSISRILAEDQALSDWVASSTDDLWQAAAQTCNAIAKYPGSQEPTETVSPTLLRTQVTERKSK